ncbi:glycosyltransferase family 4 protein [Ligilactobacillus faecis]|uniref:glycosyltransferase family 4 protein n=1 Tax=Ligilactobacillus faecis TaxID=762833 RepID=UPI0024691028|nr:glycosyltransferase family 4 protein [Ligilactobacillus faecis]WGN89703.1 glycosyltransferase family 4 protein [Ligilactobacillus faecis]
MNIGIFTDTYYPQVSGVATSIATLRAQLERKGHTVYIFTTTDPEVEKNVYERNIFRFASIPFISFTDRRIAVRGLFHSYQVAKELNLDIVHTQTEFSMGLIGKFVAKALKIPCVHTYHTMYEDYLHYVAKGKLLKPVHVRLMTCSFCEKMSGIVAPSERVLTTLENYGVKEPITVIPTGVDLTRFQAQTSASNSIRQKYQIAADTPLLLTLSRLAFEKDIDKLITAFKTIREKVTGVKLLIVGDGPARESLEAQVKELGLTTDVIFTGEIENKYVGEFYRAADLFVSTSISESQGLTYIEALAAGTRVIAYKSPYTEKLLDDPALGAVFETDEEFIEKTGAYLSAPVSKGYSEVLEQKLSEVSADNFGERIIEFYEQSRSQYLKMSRSNHSKELS